MPKVIYSILFAIAALFSFWLMWHTLNYDSQTSTILVSGKYWSDFGGHLPQIRSFSYGANWPPQYPLYPGEPIRYHFLFFALVGLLEKAGLRLDWALNIPSSLGLLALLLMIFAFSKKLFTGTRVALLSVLFFLFNGSLSWLDLLKSNNYQLMTAISHIPSLTVFPSFGPWNGSDIAAFWNLNILTNQRHLPLSMALALVILYFIYFKSDRRLYLLGFLLGFLLLINQAIFVAVCILIPVVALARPVKVKVMALISLLGAIPWILFQFLFENISGHITFHPGFLYNGQFTFNNLFFYWFHNFGLHLVLIPIGFLLGIKKTFKLLPVLLLFIIPNTFQLSVDMINNHKLFNFYLLIGCMFSAYFVARVSRIKYLGLPLAAILIIALTAGGVVDIFPVINDFYYRIPDVRVNQTAQFFYQQTPKNSVVLNSTWFYHPASLAGRKIYNGYSYFTWSFGYDQVSREKQTVNIYRAVSQADACRLLTADHINYVELSIHPESFIQPNYLLWDSLSPVFEDSRTGSKVFSVAKLCSV